MFSKAFFHGKMASFFQKQLFMKMRGDENEAMKYILSTIFKREEERKCCEGWNSAFFGWPTTLMVWWWCVVVAGAIQCLPQSWGRLRISLFAAAMEFLNGRIARRARESGKTCGLQKFRMARVGVPIFTISSLEQRTITVFLN